MVTDTISDMLTRIRNATMVKHQIVKLPYTKMSSEIARILKEEGFIEDIREHEEDPERYFVISNFKIVIEYFYKRVIKF